MTFMYNGAAYYKGIKQWSKTNPPMYTDAPSLLKAANNFRFKLAKSNGDRNKVGYWDISLNDIVYVKEKENHELHKCENCGYVLNPLGECPVCDYGEVDLLQDSL